NFYRRSGDVSKIGSIGTAIGCRQELKFKDNGKFKRWLAGLQQHIHRCPNSDIAMHNPAAAQTSTPLADDAISLISSCVVSQESTVSNSGPAMYQHNQIAKKI